LTAFAARASGWEPYRVLLAGVGFASASGAIVTLILSLAPAQQIHGMLFWLMGDLGAIADSRLAWAALAVALVLAASQASAIDLLALGPVKAAALGVAVGRVRWVGYGCAILATSAAVLLAGTVGFVGLVVPHLLRLAGIHEHRGLLPLAALAGGTLVVIADTLARTGALTALVGVPVLLVLIARSR
jgi:iron complex transport system permease protein